MLHLKQMCIKPHFFEDPIIVYLHVHKVVHIRFSLKRQMVSLEMKIAATTSKSQGCFPVDLSKSTD